jgi:predicted Ser/Thr protein kinase
MTTGTGPGSGARGSGVTGTQEHGRLGPYRLVQRLGEGGMGVVHLALDAQGRAVAIKVLRPHIAHDESARGRLAREVETLSRVRSPRVAAVLDADVDGDRPYIVTEYVPGPPLDRVVDGSGPLHGEPLLRLGRGLAEALGAIHDAGVVHRDLKPGNVLLVDDDPVVIDFGIAHVADDVRLTMTGLVMGTPGYLSPEVVEGAPVTEATDWWGWAATLSYAASGTPPFGRGPMPAVLDRVTRGQADLSGVDPRLAPLLHAALSPVAEARPDAQEVVDALERYAHGGAATTALPTTAGGHAGPPYRLDAVYDTDGPEGRGGDVAPTSVMPLRDVPGEEEESDWQAAWAMPDQPGDGPGQPDPRIGRSMRSGTIAAMLAAVVALSAIWPVVAVALVVLWSLAARFSDRSVTSLVLRRHSHGSRRSDVPLAVAASPWHLVVAVVATALSLILPAVVAAAGALSTSLGLAAARGGEPDPQRSLPVAAGMLVGLLLLWWGPGSASLRRGSRSVIRGAVRGRTLSELVVSVLLLLAAGLALWAWARHGLLDLWPLTIEHLPLPTIPRP